MVCGEEVRYDPKRSAKGTEDEWCKPWHDDGISGEWRSKWLHPEVMQIAMLLEGMKNEELRMAAMEQVRILAGVDIK